MSIRNTALFLFVVALAIYAWKDWFVSLCGLVLMTVILERPDVPRSMFNILGLNPWNVLMVAIVAAWAVTRSREGLKWDLPGLPFVILSLCLGFMVLAVMRAVMRVDQFPPEGGYTSTGLIVDGLVNTLKFVIPGILMFDGARTRRRLVMGVACVTLVGVLYALSAIKISPLSAMLHGGTFGDRARINKIAGLHANDMAMLLSATIFTLTAGIRLWKPWFLKAGVVGGLFAVLVAVVICNSRAAYLAIGALGILFGVLRWRSLLVLVPIAVVTVASLMPNVVERVSEGLGIAGIGGEKITDWEDATSGRANFWPAVIDQISESPVVGHGRYGMLHTKVREELLAMGEAPNHPHNAYLEILLDMGVVGLIPILVVYGSLIVIAIRTFLNKQDRLVSVVGAIALANVTALLVTGLASQSLLPAVSTLSMWCSWGMVYRIHLQRKYAYAGAVTPRARLTRARGMAPAC